MQTYFSPKQLADKKIKKVNDIIRTCVRCGICTTACPTYLESRDERNSPRGRIYLLKSLFESSNNEKMKTSQKYLDYCLNCKACETACPSGVEYSELTQIGREYLDNNKIRNLFDLSWRKIVLFILTSPILMRISIPLLRPLKVLKLNIGVFKFIESIPASGPVFKYRDIKYQNNLQKKQHEILLTHGCVGSIIRPSIKKSSEMVLMHLGFNVKTIPSNYCCGSLASHSGLSEMGKTQSNKLYNYVASLTNTTKLKSPIKLISTISGCTNKIEKSSKISSWEFAHFISTTNLKISRKEFLCWSKKRIVWHIPCSISHDLKTYHNIASLWKKWKLSLIQAKDQSLCCGAAGAYMLFQSSMSETLKNNKIQSLLHEKPDYIVTHNIGCLEQLRYKVNCPILVASEFIAILCGLMAVEEINR